MIDLHTHSNVSDGSLSPSELVVKAAAEGITVLGLADHDTVMGIGEARAVSAQHEIRLVPAVEISVDIPNSSMHLLGYGIDHEQQQLVDSLARLAEGREIRNRRILEVLNDNGAKIDYSFVKTLSGNGTCGRAHIADAMVKTGFVNNNDEAFQLWLRRGEPAYVDRFRLNLSEAIELVHAAGGAAVWAHPGLHGSDLDRLLTYLPDWITSGLDGLESDYCNHTIQMRDRLRKMALENGLIYTGGSDFHGDIKLNNRLGYGAEGYPVDQDCLLMLDERLSKIRQ